MSNFKGTPGPWEVDGVEIRACASHPVESICEMRPGFSREDATLIAAAPALFQALKELEEAARQVMAGEMAASSIQIERTKAQDAMAKALGGAQ